MSESPRHLAREIVLKTLYASEHGNMEPNEAFEDIISAEELSDKNIKFARDLMEITIKNREEADNIISGLAINWKLERFAAIDRMILQMAVSELKFMIDTPEKVVLNEAIELAKEYSTTDSSKFINGLLDSYLKELKASAKSN